MKEPAVETAGSFRNTLPGPREYMSDGQWVLADKGTRGAPANLTSKSAGVRL